ncbi:MAG: T9SS type A sorting domain-containing protein [Bacteroidota bacterium]
MKKIIYTFSVLAICLSLGTSLWGQRIVDIAASSNPAEPTDIFPVIMGDTMMNGDRVDNNTIYRLENGQTYVTSGRIVNTKDWPLHIEATDLNATDNKAIITREPNTSGDFQDIGRPEGDVTFQNIWLISGEKGPLEQHDWGKFRLSGAGSRIVVKDCIIEKDRGGFLQVRADSLKIFVENTIFRNGGNRRIIQGNGRAVDARNFVLDSLVMSNCVVHNLQDRFFRSQGGVTPHNYIKIDHCTAFNVAGRHGFIQLGRANTVEITNNLFSNPIMLGSSHPAYTDEQTQPDNTLHKVITIDTLYATTNLTISNNNIFWTKDVTDYWATVDSVNAPNVLSDLVKQSLGADTANAFFSEVFDLDDVPVTILEYVQDLYADPTADDMFDFIVEDSIVAGTSFDSGNLFEFDNFSPCYGSSTQSATASTTGGPVGAISFCSSLTSVSNFPEIVQNFRIIPNPVNGKARFDLQIVKGGDVRLEIFDLNGRMVDVVSEKYMTEGRHDIRWSVPAQLQTGLYMAKLSADNGVQTLKFVVN